MTLASVPYSEFSYRSEIKRKLIHISSLWMPVLVYFLPTAIAAGIFSSLLIILFIFEVLRRQEHGLARWLNDIFVPVLRSEEISTRFRLTGATYVLLAALICTLLFPAHVAITVLSIMLVADAAASLVGRRYGKTPIMGKSVEGSAAFLIAALGTITLIGTLTQHHLYFYASALAAAIVATITELFSRAVYLDDNLSIPLAAGSAMWLITVFM